MRFVLEPRSSHLEPRTCTYAFRIHPRFHRHSFRKNFFRKGDAPAILAPGRPLLHPAGLGRVQLYLPGRVRGVFLASGVHPFLIIRLPPEFGRGMGGFQGGSPGLSPPLEIMALLFPALLLPRHLGCPDRQGLWGRLFLALRYDPLLPSLGPHQNLSPRPEILLQSLGKRSDPERDPMGLDSFPSFMGCGSGSPMDEIQKPAPVEQRGPLMSSLQNSGPAERIFTADAYGQEFTSPNPNKVSKRMVAGQKILDFFP